MQLKIIPVMAGHPRRSSTGAEFPSATFLASDVSSVAANNTDDSADPDPLRVVNFRAGQSTAAPGDSQPALPEVRYVVAVASGKGGVGKSTLAANLAIALAQQGVVTGLLDTDVYGPSIPIMLGLQNERARVDERGQRLVPFERYGIRFMSLGFLVRPDAAVIWRGPMVMKAVEQLLTEVAWGKLDILVLDLPPGTGDTQLTVSQKIDLAGALIVTTPQAVALADAVKGVAMFRQVNVPVLGIVENMSYFECPHCTQRTEIFCHGGGRTEAARLNVPFLGEIPLDPGIRSSSDAGQPIVLAEPHSQSAQCFTLIAKKLLASLRTPA